MEHMSIEDSSPMYNRVAHSVLQRLMKPFSKHCSITKAAAAHAQPVSAAGSRYHANGYRFYGDLKRLERKNVRFSGERVLLIIFRDVF